MQENLILAYYAQIWKFSPRLQKWSFSKKFIFLKRSPDFASKEPSTTPDIKFKSSYARKCDYAQIWKFSPMLQKWNFSKKFILSLLKTIINKKYNITLIINNLGNYNKYINISYYTKYKQNRINNIIFFWKVLQISLPTSPQPLPDIKCKISYARKRDFGYYAQIWKFGPRLPKIEFFKKISFFCKGLQILLLTSPQPLAVMQENILSKKLSLGLNFSTPSGGVTSPSLKGSMVWV